MHEIVQTEYWQTGPVENIPALLQPVAHALLQAKREVNNLLQNFPHELCWQQVAGVASPGFHIKHITGVLDRLFTYAKGEMLSNAQLQYLADEAKGSMLENELNFLIKAFDKQINASLDFLAGVDESKLTDIRFIGRKKIPSTLIGLLFHAAEHTMRHTGQLLVTVKVLQLNYENNNHD